MLKAKLGCGVVSYFVKWKKIPNGPVLGKLTEAMSKVGGSSIMRGSSHSSNLPLSPFLSEQPPSITQICFGSVFVGEKFRLLMDEQTSRFEDSEFRTLSYLRQT